VTDVLRICAAAFFRSKGKNVITENEFLMGVSMNNRWMPYGEAERLLSSMISAGLVSKDGEYVRPCFDVAGVDVPVGYRPPGDILAGRSEDVFRTLMQRASSADIDRKDFLSSCRAVQKRLGVDVEVAAVILLRDKGIDVSDLLDWVCSLVKGR
jgi:hypothetical protein